MLVITLLRCVRAYFPSNDLLSRHFSKQIGGRLGWRFLIDDLVSDLVDDFVWATDLVLEVHSNGNLLNTIAIYNNV